MSVLIIGGRPELVSAIARRLISQGDQVRVIETQTSRREAWAELGVHVALGDASDDDLVERAAQGARTVAVLDEAVTPSVLAPILSGSQRAGVDRMVVCATRIEPAVGEMLDASGASYVTLARGRRGLLRSEAEPGLVAEAVDAADDLAGHPRLVIDLARADDLSLLGLSLPS